MRTEKMNIRRYKGTWNGLLLDLKSDENVIFSTTKDTGELKENYVYTYAIYHRTFRTIFKFENSNVEEKPFLKVKIKKNRFVYKTNLEPIDF